MAGKSAGKVAAIHDKLVSSGHDIRTLAKVKVIPGNIRVAPQERAMAGGFRKDDKEALGTKEREDRADAIKAATDGQDDAILAQKKAYEKLQDPLTDKLWFNVLVSIAVFLNAVIIGLEQELSDSKGGVADRFIWYMIELMFAIIFVLELVMRISTLQLNFFMDFWNIADMAVIVCAVLDCLVLTPAGSGGKLRLLTTIRTLRVVRLVRLIRTFPYFRELWLLVGGLVNSIKALAWVCLILFLLMYTCGIVATTEIGQNEQVYGNGVSYDGEVWPYKEYFGTVFKSMFTMFQLMTLDGWMDDVVRHIMFFQPMLGMLFIVFVILTAFGLMNVVVGVIVENTLAAATIADQSIEADKGVKRNKALDQLQLMLELSDASRSGIISLTELLASLQSSAVQEILRILDVQQADIEQLFGLLDYERRGKVELKRFILACHELVGGVKRRDIAQVEITVGALTQRLDSLDRKFSHIEGEVACLGNLAEDFLQNTVRVLTGFDGRELQPP